MLIIFVQPFVYAWGIYLYCVYVVLIGLALRVALYPVSTYHIFSLIVEIPPGIIALMEVLFWLLLTLLICFTEILIIMFGFVSIGLMFNGRLGGIIGFVAVISVVWFFGNYFSKQIDGRLTSMWKIAETISSWWFPFPARLMVAIWDIGKIVAAIFGGDIE